MGNKITFFLKELYHYGNYILLIDSLILLLYLMNNFSNDFSFFEFRNIHFKELSAKY